MSTRVDSNDTVRYEIFCKKHAPHRGREVQGVRGEKTSERHFKPSVPASLSKSSEGTQDEKNGYVGMQSGAIDELTCKDSPIVHLNSPCDGLQDTAEKCRGLGGFGSRSGAPKRKR
jgi:hypothetical protein